MKICSKSPYILLKLIHITLFPAVEAQKVETWPEVTGYLKHDVTLPCQFIQGSNFANITQFEWDLNPPEGKKITIIVSSGQHGVNIPETSLKGRVELSEQSLIIKNVSKADAGSYICSIATFPSGSFEGSTKLVVQEQLPSSPGMIAAVIAIMLLLVIMAATIYLIFMRRRDSVVRHRVYIDKDGPVMDVARPSVIRRDEDVVYSDVKLKSSREFTPLSNDKHTETAHVDDVTYSEVVILGQQPK